MNDEVVSRIVNEARLELITFRSYLQHTNAKVDPPKEVRNAAYAAKKGGKICDFCDPDLITVVDPDFYETHKTELAELIARNKTFATSPVIFGHCSYPTDFGFRGASYPLVDGEVHIDFLEMDSTDYFDGIHDSTIRQFAEHFHEYIPSNLRQQYMNYHPSIREFYVAFGTRNSSNSFDIRRAFQVDPLK